MQRGLALNIGTGPADVSSASEDLRLAFGGVEFVFEGPRALSGRIVRACQFAGSGGRAVLGSGHAGVFCHARCRLNAANERDAARWERLHGARDLALDWRGEGGSALAPGAWAEFWNRGGAGIEIEARIEASQRGARNLLGLLSGALVWNAGGAVFHAAAVELPEGVVGFIGASGAGKTTACQHVEGAQLFALDRLGVVPDSRGGWSAHPAPGGSPAERPMQSSSAQGRPLLALLRVGREARGQARFESFAGSRALSALRQATFQLNGMAGLESELLIRLERLSRAVVVGQMSFGLDAHLRLPLEQSLGGRLEAGEEKRVGA